MRFLPLLALIAAVHAYAVFDDVIPPEPQWTVPPLGAVPGDAAVIYRIVRAGDDRAWIEAQSRTNAALALRWVVPGYCDEPAELALAPNASARAAIRLKNCDHGLFSAAVLAPGQAQPRRFLIQRERQIMAGGLVIGQHLPDPVLEMFARATVSGDLFVA